MPERLSSRQVSSIPARLVLGTREEDADVASYLCSDRFRVKDKESNEVSNWVLTSCRPHRVTKRRMKEKKKKEIERIRGSSSSSRPSSSRPPLLPEGDLNKYT